MLVDRNPKSIFSKRFNTRIGEQTDGWIKCQTNSQADNRGTQHFPLHIGVFNKFITNTPLQAGTLQDRKHINRMCLYIKRNENYSLPGYMYIVKTTAPKI